MPGTSDGKKVLLVDADPQANATSGLGVNPDEAKSSIYECLVDGANAATAVMPTCVEGLGAHLFPHGSRRGGGRA